MAYKLAVLEILRNVFVLAYIACPRYPYWHIGYGWHNAVPIIICMLTVWWWPTSRLFCCLVPPCICV